ncbi:MAG: hypothetical protein HYV00_03705, partial [Deltaproteobacteria bacterium]|nr:hypothetical protein [Deltaproteobacteria bacterium]
MYNNVVKACLPKVHLYLPVLVSIFVLFSLSLPQSIAISAEPQSFADAQQAARQEAFNLILQELKDQLRELVLRMRADIARCDRDSFVRDMEELIRLDYFVGDLRIVVLTDVWRRLLDNLASDILSEELDLDRQWRERAPSCD